MYMEILHKLTFIEYTNLYDFNQPELAAIIIKLYHDMCI